MAAVAGELIDLSGPEIGERGAARLATDGSATAWDIGDRGASRIGEVVIYGPGPLPYQHVMRAWNTTQTKYVYWLARDIEQATMDYPHTGDITDIVVYKTLL